MACWDSSRKMHRAGFVLSIFLGACATTAGRGPSGPQTLLHCVSRTYRARISTTYFTQTFNQARVSRGRLSIASRDKVRVDYFAPERKSFIRNGTTMWVLDHGASQVLQVKPAGGNIWGVFVDPGARYAVRWIRQPDRLQVAPKDGADLFTYVAVKVDPDTCLLRTMVFHHGNDVNRFDFIRWRQPQSGSIGLFFPPRHIPVARQKERK